LAASFVALVGLTLGHATAQYCPVTSTYFTGNYALAGCTIGTCWAPAPFPGSIPKAGTQYPSTNYICAAAAPATGALENALNAFDANGNLTTAKDPLAHSTTNSYDALNRVTQVLDPAGNTTKYAYRANNTLLQVTDPRALNTVYSPNGFGETLQLNSPDTGITTNTYDPMGRLITKNDARLVNLASYTYDDLGRVISESYQGGGSVTYTYDQGTYGKGRLTSVFGVTSTSFTYEAHGRVTQKTQVLGTVSRTVGYHYDAYGRLDQLTYPSGMIVVFGYTNGKITSINAAGQSVLTGAIYSPFGAIKNWTWGNGQAYARTIDLDGRVTSYPRNTNTQALGFDVASRITSITDSNATLNQSFGYDNLDRLISDDPLNGGTQPARSYAYDPNGNRLTSTLSGVLTTYDTPAASNRLASTTTGASYTYDPIGNIVSDGTRTFAYNARGRMNSATVGGQTTTYKIDAFGRRVQKINGATSTIYVHDEAGQLLGEYDGTGAQIAEHIYFNGMPVAVMKFVAGNPVVYQVYPDHLGTPRAIIDSVTRQAVWRWHNVDPFAGNLPEENPAGLGTFNYNLRFPGQYYDIETGLHYNYFRDYDPQIGRYREGDPIGLRGGRNVYTYANDSPLRFRDPSGERYEDPEPPIGWPIFPEPPGTKVPGGPPWSEHKQCMWTCHAIAYPGCVLTGAAATFGSGMSGPGAFAVGICTNAACNALFAQMVCEEVCKPSPAPAPFHPLPPADPNAPPAEPISTF